MSGWVLIYENANIDVHNHSGVITSKNNEVCLGPMGDCMASDSMYSVTIKLSEDDINFHAFNDCGDITQTFVNPNCNRDALIMWFNHGDNTSYDKVLDINQWDNGFIDSKNVDECDIVVINKNDKNGQNMIHCGGQNFTTNKYVDSSYPFVSVISDDGTPEMVINPQTQEEEIKRKYTAQQGGYLGHKIKYHIASGSTSRITIPNNFFRGSDELVELYFQTNIKEIEDGTFNAGAFSDCVNLSAITLNKVEKIGDSAFKGCTNLRSIDLSNFKCGYKSLKTIGSYAFYECSSISGIYIPDSVTTIGNGTFIGCTNLSSITISSGITEIGWNVFDDTSWWASYSAETEHRHGNIVYINDIAYKAVNLTITSATFASDTICVAGNAFSGCTNLTSITIPSSVQTIGDGAFYECTNLESVTLNSGLLKINDTAFFSCAKLSAITIPNSVKRIGLEAFSDCSSMTSCTIGSGVEEIGGGAFQNCFNLTTITVNAVEPPTLGRYVFDGVNLTAIYVPSSSVETYKTASRWSDFASIIQPKQ